MVDYKACQINEGVMAETITVTEAAADAGITRWAVWAAINRGNLQAVKRGRDWHIERTEWERYRRETRRPAAIDSDRDTGGGATTGTADDGLAQQDWK